MKLNKMKLEELELMSYTDMAYTILMDAKKPLKTPDIFKEICSLLSLSEEEYTNKIGEFYTSLTMDKRFLLLASNDWDIRDRHSVEFVLEEEEEEEELEEEEKEEEFEEEMEDDIDDVIDDDIDDDLDDLAIVADEDLDEDN